MSNNSSSSGIGFFGLMFLIFMTLKLLGIITWSWWWVTVPLWGGFAVVATVVVAVLATVGLIGWLYEPKAKGK